MKNDQKYELHVQTFGGGYFEASNRECAAQCYTIESDERAQTNLHYRVCGSYAFKKLSPP